VVAQEGERGFDGEQVAGEAAVRAQICIHNGSGSGCGYGCRF
jgi:hypothetical protein